MAVTSERFEQGLTYDEYKAQMNRNKERFEVIEGRVELDPEAVATFKGLPQPLRVLVLAEDWCGDVIAGLPVLGRLAQEVGTLDVRVFLRDQNLDIMDQYLNKGEFRSIPVFVFFDQEMNELGRMTERPASVTDKLAERRRALHEQNPEFGPPGTSPNDLDEATRVRLQQATMGIRDELEPWINAELVSELRTIGTSARV